MGQHQEYQHVCIRKSFLKYKIVQMTDCNTVLLGL